MNNQMTPSKITPSQQFKSLASMILIYVNFALTLFTLNTSTLIFTSIMTLYSLNAKSNDFNFSHSTSPLCLSHYYISHYVIESESSGNSHSPLYDSLLFKPRTDELSDLAEQSKFPRINAWLNKISLTLHNNSSREDRLKVARNIEIAKIVAAPGHRKLRNPGQVEGLLNYIQQSNGGDFSHDPLLINLITDQKGNIESVDLWNAHHRLVAYLEARYQYLGDIPEKNFLILVNGHNEYGEKWGHFLSIGALDEKMMKDYSAVTPNSYIRVGTISMDGGLSNFQLGSKNTIKRLRESTFSPRRFRLGVYFGTFDPVHEGHITLAKKALQDYELDEVVIVANPSPSHKPNASVLRIRNEMLALHLNNSDTKKINLYIGDSAQIINQFGRDPFFERLNQIYSPSEIFQIIGTDSFDKLLKENNVATLSSKKYIVYSRDENEFFEVPPFLDGVVFKGGLSSFNTSSTNIRKKILANVTPSHEEIDFRVYDYIMKNKLYLR